MLGLQTGILIAFVLICTCLSYLIHQRWTAIRYRRRFLLFDLLVVVTLFSAVAGLIVGLKTDKSPRRYQWASDFMQELRDTRPDEN